MGGREPVELLQCTSNKGMSEFLGKCGHGWTCDLPGEIFETNQFLLLALMDGEIRLVLSQSPPFR